MDGNFPEGGDHRPTNFPYLWESVSDNETPLRPGGQCLVGLSATTLLVGDVVYLSAADSFNKSVTVGNYTGLKGIVVGGEQTYMRISQNDALIGSQIAAKLNERVIVMYEGIAKTLSDAAIAALNTKLTAGGTTAGRIGSTGAAAGNYVGVNLDTAGAAAVPIRVAVGMVA